jgi:DNA-binding response OmpR family regulator
VYRVGQYIPLSRKEFAVLAELLRADGGVLSAEDLLERAWDENIDPFTNVVRVTVMKLRRKLGDPQVVETVPGVGYRIP